MLPKWLNRTQQWILAVAGFCIVALVFYTVIWERREVPGARPWDAWLSDTRGRERMFGGLPISELVDERTVLEGIYRERHPNYKIPTEANWSTAAIPFIAILFVAVISICFAAPTPQGNYMLNTMQRNILIAGVVAFAAMGLFPPWIDRGYSRYGFIMNPPYGYIHIEVTRLIVQWIVLGVVVGVAVWLTKTPPSP